MSENIVDLYTEEYVQKILKAWYPYSKMTVNDKVALKIFEIIQTSKNCTTYVAGLENLIGGPVGTSRSLTGAAVKEIRSTLKKASEDQHALACLRTLSGAYQNELIYLGM